MSNKIIYIILAFVVVILAISLVTRPDTTEQDSDKIVALSTFTVLADMVSEVGGSKVESISLTRPGVEVHDYELTPSDLRQASRAQIVFENGLGLEEWIHQLRANIPDVPTFNASEGVEVLFITSDEAAGEPDPHAWMSPEQGLIYVENIRQALTETAPEHADYFAANAATYNEQISEVGRRLETLFATIPNEHRVLVTCEGAFKYLANDFAFEPVYIWATNAEEEGTPQQVIRVIEIVNEKQVPTVFCESTVGPQIQREVANATGAEFGGILYVDSLSPEDGPAPTYLELLEYTANTITAGLASTPQQDT